MGENKLLPLILPKFSPSNCLAHSGGLQDLLPYQAPLRLGGLAPAHGSGLAGRCFNCYEMACNVGRFP